MSSHRKDGESISNGNESVASRFLEKLASILLRLGFDSPRAESLIRQAFVQEAARFARQIGGRSTQSQIALIAGVNRLDVRKILASQHRPHSRKNFSHQSRVERILLAWREDPDFTDEQGHPKPLTVTGAKSQFERLVRKYGRDVTVRTIRDDLIKNKIAARKGTRLVLKKRGRTIDSSSAAALVDLNFLNSQLAPFDFTRGHRAFVARNLALSTTDLKLLKLARRKAIARIETALSSLKSLQRSLSTTGSNRGKRIHRLRITAILSAESDSAEDWRAVIQGYKR
jgi:hypothetical protein